MALINREALLEKIQFRIEPQGIVGETVRDMVEKTREIIMDEPIVKDINVPSWIPVTERLPDYFSVFIIAVRMPYREGLLVDSADFDPFAKTWLPSMCWGKGYEVTHWMPLPEPPKEVE